MMIPMRDETLAVNSKIGVPSSTIWFYLTIEFLIGGLLSGFLTILAVVKSLLPKPPRNISGDVVLIAGASSSLGESLADEFAKNGCSVVCVDNDSKSLEEMTSRLRSNYPMIEEVRPRRGKDGRLPMESPITAYTCDLMDRDNIRNTAKRVKDDVGRIDILVTCVGSPDQDIFDTASRTLMSHFWTVLAFLPLMLYRERAHVVGVTPVTSSSDAYHGSRAAIAGLMESLCGELRNRSNHFTFLAFSPIARGRSLKQSEQQVARDIVEAVRTDQNNPSSSWTSKFLYRISYIMYNGITLLTQWIHLQGCDYPA